MAWCRAGVVVWQQQNTPKAVVFERYSRRTKVIASAVEVIGIAHRQGLVEVPVEMAHAATKLTRAS